MRIMVDVEKRNIVPPQSDRSPGYARKIRSSHTYLQAYVEPQPAAAEPRLTVCVLWRRETMGPPVGSSSGQQRAGRSTASEIVCSTAKMASIEQSETSHRHTLEDLLPPYPCELTEFDWLFPASDGPRRLPCTWSLEPSEPEDPETIRRTRTLQMQQTHILRLLAEVSALRRELYRCG